MSESKDTGESWVFIMDTTNLVIKILRSILFYCMLCFPKIKSVFTHPTVSKVE